MIEIKSAPMEVKVINKQKFLAELGRLLTFMYEEDRQTALAMYSEMFDDATEEQSMLQFLVSPTRQAVVLARAYDAQERKLQVHTQSREGNYDYNGQVPQFVLAIDDLRQKAAAMGMFAQSDSAQATDENQFSLFDEVSQIGDTAAPAQDSEPQSTGDVDAFANAVDAFLADLTLNGHIQSKSSEDEDSDLVLPARVTERLDDSSDNYLNSDEGLSLESEVQPIEEEAPAELIEQDIVEATDNVSELEEDVAEISEDVSGNSKEAHKVSVKDLRKHPKTEENNDSAEAAVPDTVTVKPMVKAADGSKKNSELDELDSSELDQVETIRKANTPLLILFIILAIIPTLLGIALLLIPTLLCLGIAVAFVSSGVLVLTAAFSGFTIFADLMIVLGLAIILLALGLLFTWMFIWFIGGAIVGFVRAVCHLGGKLCFKEVAAQ